MKLLSYNLRDGAIATYEMLLDFVIAEQPDILCLQEANDWHRGTPSRIEDFAKRAGFTAWQFGDSNTAFDLITYSRLPIASSESITNGFWHSAVRTTVTWQDKPLTIWNVHLNPFDEDNRLAEAKEVIRRSASHNRTIITGDINSISRSDPYPTNLLETLLATHITKFGNHELRFDTTDYIKSEGFVDIAAELKNTQNTVPTQANNDHDHMIELRLDYVYTSSDIASSATNIKVIKNTPTDSISDHYPLAVIIN